MSLADLIVPPWAKLLAAGMALVAAAGVGAAVNGWRLNSAHQAEMAAEKDKYELLAGKVREQNSAVAAMGMVAKASDERREVAERYAADVIKAISKRSASVAASKEATCDGVLREAWGSK